MPTVGRPIIKTLKACEYVLRFDKDPTDIRMKATLSFSAFKKQLKIKKDEMIFYRRPSMSPREVQFDDNTGYDEFLKFAIGRVVEAWRASEEDFQEPD